MGIARALLEATTTDRDTTRILNPGLNEYLSPTHADVPVIDVAFIEEHDGKINVLGVKGIGELPCGGRKLPETRRDGQPLSHSESYDPRDRDLGRGTNLLLCSEIEFVHPTRSEIVSLTASDSSRIALLSRRSV